MITGVYSVQHGCNVNDSKDMWGSEKSDLAAFANIFLAVSCESASARSSYLIGDVYQDSKITCVAFTLLRCELLICNLNHSLDAAKKD